MKFVLFKKKNKMPTQISEFHTEDITKKSVKDWELMLVVFIVVNLALGGGAAYFFNRVNSGSLFRVNEEFTATPEIDVNILKKIVERYDTKQKEFEDLKIDANTQIDPSL